MEKKPFLKGCLITIIVFVVIIALIIAFFAFNGGIGVKKPNIYIYPEKKENITVRLNPRGRITKSIPQYNKGWDVHVEPNGKIDGQFDYLFYEAKVNYNFTLDRGWIVSKTDFYSQMDAILQKIGLKSNEINDFMSYWGSEIKWKKDKYTIYLIKQKEIDEAIPLEISKVPESLLRVYFYFEPLEKNLTIEEPEISTFERKGFTVVEWGGIGE